ncbi:hypothetical protein O181_082869 [Austropuccinia psidii MF-1]|uniref:MARVEL domain-containing protein n=1 Tax=Austropuccinia psidii MF-1 TaxID=1389203 RepID=A0A9Q3FQI8_9BASI|nr:hypothetical protein [Austropuccinia psidii MF-1]
MSPESSMKSFLHPALFFLSWVFALIEFLITAILVHNYDSNGYPTDSVRDRLRFLLFVSCWTLLFVPVYIAANLRAPGRAIASISSNLAFTSVTWLFWFSGAIAWTDALGGTLHCGDLFLQNSVIEISIPYCGSLRAAQAFSWMILITFSAILGYVGLSAAKARKAPGGLSGPMRETSTPA